MLTSAFTGRDERPHATGATTFASQRDDRAAEIMRRDGIDLIRATELAEAELRGAARAS